MHQSRESSRRSRMIRAAVPVLVVLAAACNSKPKNDAPAASAPGPLGPSPFAPSVERAMPHYAEGYNTLVDLMDNPLDRYGEQVGDIQGPPERKPILIHINPIDMKKIDEVAAAFADGKKALPPGNAAMSDPADKAVVAARAVIKDYEDAVTYYSAEKYKDDEGKGGLEIHKRITADAEAYQNAIHGLDLELKKVEKTTMVEDFKRHGDPTTYSHQFRAFNLPAMAFMDVGDDPAEAKKVFSEIDAAYKKVKAFADAKGANLHPTFSGYMHQVNNFYEQTAVVSRGLGQDPAPQNFDVELQKLTSFYNNLIDLTNSLYDMEAKGYLK